MIRLIAYDPIDFWFIFEEHDSIYLLKPPYTNIENKVSISKEKMEEAILKRGFILSDKHFSGLDEVLFFIDKEKSTQEQESGELFNPKELEEFYTYIPVQPLQMFYSKYETKLNTLTLDKRNALSYILNTILSNNCYIQEDTQLLEKFQSLNELCKKQIEEIIEKKENTYKDLSKNSDFRDKILLNVSDFLSAGKKLSFGF